MIPLVRVGNDPPGKEYRGRSSALEEGRRSAHIPPNSLPAGFAVAYCLATFPAIASQSTAPGPKVARASLGISVRIPPVLSLQLLDHPAALTVSDEEAARGEVLVRGARLEIRANDPAGFRLKGEISGAQVSQVEITGLDAGLRVQEGMAFDVHLPRTEAHAVPRTVEYRFVLRPGTAAGSYQWPAALRVESR